MEPQWNGKEVHPCSAELLEELGFELPPFLASICPLNCSKTQSHNKHLNLQMHSLICKNYARSPALLLKIQHYSTLQLLFSLAKFLWKAFWKLANRDRSVCLLSASPTMIFLKSELYRGKKEIIVLLPSIQLYYVM